MDLIKYQILTFFFFGGVLLIKESGVSAWITRINHTGKDPIYSNNPSSFCGCTGVAAFFRGWFSSFMGFFKGSNV